MKYSQEDKNYLGEAPVNKLLFRLAIPTIAAQLINMLYNIVDRIYIGHISDAGSLALTGVGVCLPIIMIVSAFAALVGNGGAPRASISMGKNDITSAENILGNCFSLQILISLVLTVVLLLFNEPLLLAFGASYFSGGIMCLDHILFTRGKNQIKIKAFLHEASGKCHIALYCVRFSDFCHAGQ